MLKNIRFTIIFFITLLVVILTLPNSVSAATCGCDSPTATYKGACQSMSTKTTCQGMPPAFGCSWIACAVNTPAVNPVDPGNPGNSSAPGNPGGDPIYSNCTITYIGDDLSPRANSDNCNGLYSLKNPLGNFGDPSCTLTGSSADRINKIMTKVKEKDPANAAKWQSIIMCESSFNTNNYAPIAVNSDAWGLFQMGPSYTTTSPRKPDPGLGPDIPGLNGVTDRGDVEWMTQITKAIGHNAISKVTWSYWQCAKPEYLEKI